MKPYPSYQPTDVPWLVRVPEHWGIERAKSLFRVIDVKSKTGREELLTVSSAKGIVRRRESNVNMFKAKTYVGHKLCWPEDLVINSLWAWGRGLGFAREHGIISSAYGVYRLRPEHGHLWQYLDYTLRSSAYQWELQVRSKGVWKSRLQLSDPSFLAMPILIPPKEDADLIVRYLHALDAKVKRYIRTKRKLIAALQEQNQAIIQRAVTRGLYPNVKLKPSGVEWLGEVPEHWEVVQIRRIASFVTSGSRGWAAHYSDSGDIFLQSGNLGRSMELNMSYTQYVKPPDGSEGMRTRVQRDDVLICITGALTGNVAIVDRDFPVPAYVNQHVALLRLRPSLVYPRFLTFVLHSELGRVQFKTSENGGTKQGLGLDDVKAAAVPLPTIDEQIAICKATDERCKQFTDAIGRAEAEIKVMQEYHTRLVADVVTGAVDVRTAAKAMAVDAPEITKEEPLSMAAGAEEEYGSEAVES